MKNKKSILVVGCGLSGIVAASELAKNGYNVTIIDKRDHIGGNCYDYVNEYGILVHKYGPHLFHTKNENVFKWFISYANPIAYKHKVKALLSDGRYVTLPVNKETKEIIGEENIIDVLFRPYTKKMWNREIEELNPEILNRVPIRDDDNEFYFPDDDFQFMPEGGYTKMFENILQGHDIKVKLNTEFEYIMEKDYDYIFNSMPIDKYYLFVHGLLEYRSLKFTDVNIPTSTLLPTATVNFTHNGHHTRMTEWSNIPNSNKNDAMTTITYEEPCNYEDNNFEPYYPVKDLDGKNDIMYKLYNSIKNDKIIFIGRCGKYKYMNMDETIADTLNVVNNFLVDRSILNK